MLVVNDILNYLCRLAPLQLKMDFDNCGLLLGRGDNKVSKVLLALDVTDVVVKEAIEIGANLIVSHHPLIFSGIKALTDNKLLTLVENNISVISMHTNLDIAPGGVNDVLISMLGAKCTDVLDEHGCGRVGMLDNELDIKEFLSICKETLKCNGLRYYSSGKKVKNLAVMGGSGGDCIDNAFKKGCDTYITADIKYHQFQRAAELGINLIDADHFSTENPIISVLKDRLADRYPDTIFVVSELHKAIISFA